MPKLTFTCQHCQQPFMAYNREGGNPRKYCSATCRVAGLAKSGIQTATCQHCGKEFNGYLHSRKELKYCSNACSGAATRSAEQVTVRCLGCNDLFTARLSSARDNPKYCSRECQQRNSAAQVPHVCAECGKPFTYYQSIPRIYCSKACAGKHSVAVQQNPVQIPRNCLWCGKRLETKRKGYRAHCCSYACARHARYANRVMEITDDSVFSTAWRGPNWQQQRRNARHRDQYTCQRCGITEIQLCQQLDVHHLIPFRSYKPTEYTIANRVENLLSLCKDCHVYVEFHGWPC